MRNVIVVCALLPAAIQAQAPRTIGLPAANARLEVEFSDVIAIRELSDGRIVVADPTDLQLVVADFRNNSVKQISSRGRGPGEYGRVARLFALGADSTLMPDLTQRRWLVLARDSVVRTLPPDDPIVRKTPFGILSGADALGNIYVPFSSDPPDGASTTSPADSTTIARINRASGKIDTIGRTLDRPFARTVTRNARGEVSSSSARALRLRVGEQYLAYPDGWVAIVRINPFRVDWRSPDGRWTLGAPLPVPVLRMTDREKRASLARTAASVAANPSNTPLPPQLRTPDDDWPDVMPPYIQGDIIGSPDGDVILRRQPSADHPGMAYYVIDRRGRLLGTIAVRDNERLFASGARSVYVVETDADGLKHIRRHPWPSTRIPG
jgi:hypothetical protein